MKRIPKCSVQLMCSSLSERVDGVNENRKGFSLMVTTNFETGKNTRIGVVYKTSSKDRGLIINHCPFCGFDFEEWIDAAIESGAVRPRSEWASDGDGEAVQ